MPQDTHNHLLLRTHRRNRQGQTAVVALLVLLLLAFIGALFITIIARNLRSQDRSHRTLSADYYAEAGIRFADDQLTNSLDGADWRPPLLKAYATVPATLTGRALARYNAAFPVVGGVNTPQADTQDPDYKYLSQGFTRYDTDNGRFLLRITYDPIHASTTDAPNARYLKIESIGRQGVVQDYDPTTYTNQPPTKLAASLVAYKPIGITDYARFETNIDKRNDTASLGVPSQYHMNMGASDPTPNGIVTPGVFDFNLSGGVTLPQYPLITAYGAPDAYITPTPVPASGVQVLYPNPNAGTSGAAPMGYTLVPGGGSIRANMPLRIYGKNLTYLNRDSSTTALDDIEVAGNLLLNDYRPSGAASAANTTNLSQGQSSALAFDTTNPATGQTTTTYVAPSNGVDTAANTGTPFDTNTGAVRDGGTGNNSNDAEGNPRSITRLEPPVIDAISPATRLTRYQDLTENSPRRATYGGTAITDPNASADGFGQAIYVNNISDKQEDSGSLVGGHTLVDEWLNRNSGGQSAVTAKSGWQGPFYNPPGIDITLGVVGRTPGVIAASPIYGVRLTRSDVDAAGKPQYWAKPDGTAGTSPTLTVPYADLNATNDPTIDPSTLSGAALAEYHANPNNDVVIYAEGNIRVRPSVVSDGAGTAPVHVTLITNGTAYIEGSILKGNPDSSVTILARDYVCLNTTQFYSGAIADEDAQSAHRPSASVTDSTLLDFSAADDVLVQDFNFSAPPVATITALYISGGPSAAGATQAQFDFVNPATGYSLYGANSSPFDAAAIPTATFDSATGVTGSATVGPGATGLTHITFDLTGSGLPNGPLQLWTRRGPGQDQINGSVTAVNATQDYVQERSAILPGDIKIQAMLYAQNKSFFVIPGPWFNSDAGDNLTAYQGTGFASRPGIDTASVDSARFPFYGQPVDLKITVDGTVSEARPADISAQAAWMQKWGWIPQYHGSNLGATPEKAGHPGYDPFGSVSPAAAPAAGLTLIYDPQAGYPFNQTATGGAYYLRSDVYGRPLPFTPKLPVSTGLLYAGQGDPQAVLP